MGWTVNFFAHKAEEWQKMAEGSALKGHRGHECYAREQESFWLGMKSNAETKFRQAIRALYPDKEVVILGLQVPRSDAADDPEPAAERAPPDEEWEFDRQNVDRSGSPMSTDSDRPPSVASDLFDMTPMH